MVDQESREQINTLGFRVRTVAPPPIAQSIPMPPPSKQARKRSIRKPSSLPEIYDVALSFAGEDRQYVDEVAHLLKEAGVRVFYDKFEEVELWGKNLLDHFAKIYAEGSQFVVLFASKHYSAKAWTNHERKQAQAHAFKESKDFILPARFDDTEIPGLPATVAYIDLRSVLPGKFAELIIAKLRT